MRCLKLIGVTGLVLFLLAPGLFAQRPQRRPDQGSVSRPTVNRSTVRPTTGVSRATARPTTGTASVSGTASNSSAGLGSASTSRYNDPYYNHCDRFVNGIWYYNPFYRSWYSWGDRARFFALLSRLGWDYRLYGFQLNRSLQRFSFADTPLTSDLLKLMLEGSTQASNALLADTKALKQLMSEYESGAIGKQAFEEQSLELLNRIRDFAKVIRKDEYLEYVDSDHDVKPRDYRPTTDLAEMRSLVAELEEMALQVQSRLDAIRSDEDVRTVSLTVLQQPSVDSLSKGIDQLAKALKKSSKRL